MMLIDITTAVYDFDAVAERLRVGADSDRLTALIAADLVPARLAPASTARPTVVEREPERILAENAAVEVPAVEPAILEVIGPEKAFEVPEIEAAPESVLPPAGRPARRLRKAAAGSVPRRTASATQQAAQALANTGLDTGAVAQLLGIIERYARQLLGSRDLTGTRHGASSRPPACLRKALMPPCISHIPATGTWSPSARRPTPVWSRGRTRRRRSAFSETGGPPRRRPATRLCGTCTAAVT